MPSMVPVAWAISSMIFTRASAGHCKRAEHFVGIGLQRVSGEDGGCFSERYVAGGASATQVVIIERGQVVVDERIGVDHLQRGAEFVDPAGKGTGDHSRRLHAENGAQALPSGKDAVSHGLVYGGRIGRAGREQTLERGVGDLQTFYKDVFQHEMESISKVSS